MTTQGSAATPAKGKGAVVTGAVLLVLGIVLGGLGVAVFGGTAKEIAGTTVSGVATAPAEVTADLKAATTYAVYEQTGSATTVKPADVTVTAADGTALTVSAPASAVVANGDGGTKLTEVAIFDIGTSGTFTVKVATEGVTYAVAPSLSVEAQGFAWGAAVIVGIVLAVIGLIVLIVGLVQRSRA